MTGKKALIVYLSQRRLQGQSTGEIYLIGPGVWNFLLGMDKSDQIVSNTYRRP